MSDTHLFTEAGLGRAPFTFKGVYENLFKMPDGNVKAGGCCDYCFTGIRHEFHIQSADGKRSSVGSECIRKVGDRGLIDAAKAAEAQRRREAAQAKREAARLAELDCQRAANGGLTNYELREKEAVDAAQAEAEARRPIAELLSPLADAIEDGRGGFCDSISRDMRAGNLPAGRGASLVCEIIAKKAGRKNSEAYEAEFTRVEKILARAEEIETP